MTTLNQALHILKNDLHRFRLPLAGLGVVIGLHVSGLWPDASVRGMARMPVGLLPLALGALAAVAVQRDSPFDDRAFWTTRPLDPGAMLFAKMLFVGLLVAVPVGIEAAWFASLGAGADVGPMLVDSGILLSVVVLGAAACGAMTKSLKGGLASAIGVFIVVSLLRRGALLDIQMLESGVRASQMFVQRAVWIVIGVAVVSHQYLTRDTKRSLGIVALALLATTPLVRQSRINLTTPLLAEAAPERIGGWTHADELDLHLVNLRIDQQRRGLAANHQDGMAAVIAFEGGSGAILSVTGSRARVEGTPGGGFSPAPIVGREEGSEPMGWRFVRPAIDGMTLAAGRTPVSTQVRTWIALDDPDDDEATLDRMREGGRLVLEVDLDAYEPRVVATMTPEAGSTVDLPGGGELIVQTYESSPRTIRMEVGHRWQPSHLLRTRRPSPLREEISFALRSRKYNEFIMDTGGSGQGRRYSLTGGATLFEPSQWLEFEAKFAEGRDGPRLPADWFDDVELVVLEAEYVGSFTKSITRDIPQWPSGHAPRTVDGFPPS